MAEKFSPEESIRVIQSMIEKTRQGISGHYYLLLWGWCSLIACIGQFLLWNVFKYEKHSLVWLITIPCWIVSKLYQATLCDHVFGGLPGGCYPGK